MKAAYFGTFEPFQNYHLDIIKKASRLFDTVDVAITINSQNRNNYNFIDCKHIIKNIIEKEGITNCQIDCSYTLNIQYCLEHHIDYIIQGFNERLDVLHECESIMLNRSICDSIETIFLASKLPYICPNSLIELVRNEIDVSTYIPKDYYDYMYLQEKKKGSS